MSLAVSLIEVLPTEVYEANLTHNLGEMAEQASLYQALWRPEELNLKTAQQLIPYLEEGLAKLNSDPKKYKEYNPPNGWGDYNTLLKFVENYLIACQENPTSKIEVSR